jgi:hypothetical protein
MFTHIGQPLRRRRDSPVTTMLLVGMACMMVAATGCGSDSESRSPQANPNPRPAVAARAVHGDRFFGFRAISGLTVRTDPGELSADLPGFYANPEKAVADLRIDGFVAGVGRNFKSEDGPDVATHVVVQTRDAQGAKAEFEREIDSLLHLPCPPDLKCEQETERFDIPRIPGAAGVNTTQTIKTPPGSLHPDILRADAIVFRSDTFVEQVFLGTERPSKHRAALIRAAQRLYQQGI